MIKTSQKSEIRSQKKVFSLLRTTCSLCILTSAFCLGVETPSRIFFSDGKISFVVPQHWSLEPEFPFGPLFYKTTQDKSTARIACAISEPLQDNRISEDIPLEKLRELAHQQLGSTSDVRILGEKTMTVTGHHAIEITWLSSTAKDALQQRSVYLFLENRLYALALQAAPRSFPWLTRDFEAWLATLRFLSRKNGGVLDEPAHGGVWIHQTGGAKITIPEAWLIGVADDQMLGAALAQGNFHCELTATADVGNNPKPGISSRDKKEFRRALQKKGFEILQESEEPFHGLPAFLITYEGSRGDRPIEGQDLWVVSPKARWLFSFEGDVTLYSVFSTQYADILKSIQFL